jgi:membrane-associated phospholipid phosphatase
MASSGIQWSPPPNWNVCRRELIIALDLVAACVFAQLFLDHWLAALLSQVQRSPIVHALSFVPDRVKLSVLLALLMLVLIAYRVASGNRCRADRGMFVLGCGVVSGFAADKLKIVFGRLPPEALLTDGAYGFHFFNGGSGLDSFPSSHAAMAAGIAGAVAAIWPAYAWMFIVSAMVIAASRFITGAHYVSDALLGGAVGLGIVALMQIVFHRCGIDIGPGTPAKQ